MKNRQERFKDIHKLIEDEQGGFKRGRRTMEQLFALREAKLEAKEKNKLVFAAFLNIKKTYDCVFRKGLFTKLWKQRIRGKFWRMVLEMYEITRIKVKLGEIETEYFEIIVGIIQGSVLGPILFFLFINDLIKILKKFCSGANFRATIRFIALFFAGDISLLSNNENDFRRMLNL